MPAQISQLIGAIHEQGPAATVPVQTGLSDALEEIETRPRRFEFATPAPWAAAVAVMGMLAFGLLVGSLAGGTSVETLAGAPLIVVGLERPAPAPPVVAAAPNQDDPAPATPTATAPAATAATTQPADLAASPTTSSVPTTGTDTTTTGSGGLPPVKHVFLIVLSDRGFAHSFGGGAASGYLAGALRRQGELVQNYYAVAGAPLANEIALISGQGPTAQTASDCPVFKRVTPGVKGRRGQVLGTGCVYPNATKTLAGQLSSAGDSWKVYLQGASAPACQVPKLGSDTTRTVGAHANYVAWRNPFLYFRSLTAGTACQRADAGVKQLARDLQSETTAPSLAYIIPASCADGSEAPCRPNATPGLAATNRFLRSVVPKIKRSAAYKDGGLIAITFDEAPQAGSDADPSACCSNPTYPNLRRLAPGMPAVPPAAMGTGAITTDTTTTDTTTTTTDTTTTDTTTTDRTTTGTTTTPATSLGSGEITPTGGGGQVGLLLISRYVKPNSIDVIDYFNHFSLLASIEDLFGLHRLGYAGVPGLPVFGLGVFNAYAG